MQQISLEKGLLISLSDISPSPVEFVICSRLLPVSGGIQGSGASIQCEVDSGKLLRQWPQLTIVTAKQFLQ
jgi:hypothetical protein